MQRSRSPTAPRPLSRASTEYLHAEIARVLFPLLAGCGGGGSSPSQTIYPVAGSYYGTVVSSSNNSGNMGITTDAQGNGNVAVQFPGESPFQATFSPPVSSTTTTALHVAGSLDGCTFSLNAATTSSNTLKGSYQLQCPTASGSASFNLPHGTYTVTSAARKLSNI